MPYQMKVYVDGACRGNGQPGAKGAAAAVHERRWDSHHYSELLPRQPQPTNQRAELRAVIMALELAVKRYQRLSKNPRINLMIFSDSTYVINCMTEWQFKWRENGWMKAAGQPLVNRDLIQRACDLEDYLEQNCDAKITYTWIPREDNMTADQCCKQALDDSD